MLVITLHLREYTGKQRLCSEFGRAGNGRLMVDINHLLPAVRGFANYLFLPLIHALLCQI